LNGSIDAVMGALKEQLLGAKLYDKEAVAMLKTWKDSWFEEGVRMLYLLPRGTTDAILPLTLDPAPDELVRVMVGRMEFITPEREAAICKVIEKLGSED